MSSKNGFGKFIEKKKKRVVDQRARVTPDRNQLLKFATIAQQNAI